MQASSKFSVRSETDQQEIEPTLKNKNIFKKVEKMQLPLKDDGSPGANVVSMDQMARNLIRTSSENIDTKKDADD